MPLKRRYFEQFCLQSLSTTKKTFTNKMYTLVLSVRSNVVTTSRMVTVHNGRQCSNEPYVVGALWNEDRNFVEGNPASERLDRHWSCEVVTLHNVASDDGQCVKDIDVFHSFAHDTEP